jgi:hypothetical protein
MKSKSKKKASLLVGLSNQDKAKLIDKAKTSEEKTNLMKEFFKFTTFAPSKEEVERIKKSSNQKTISKPRSSPDNIFEFRKSIEEINPFEKPLPLPNELRSSNSIEGLLKKLINDAVTVAVKEATSKKEKVVSPSEEWLVSNIQKIINSDISFQNKVRDLYVMLSKEVYNTSRIANQERNDNVPKDIAGIPVESEMTDQEKLRELAVKNNLTGAMHFLYPNEAMAANDIASHVNEERLASRLLEIQSSIAKPKIKKTKKAPKKAPKKANRKQRNDKR